MKSFVEEALTPEVTLYFADALHRGSRAAVKLGCMTPPPSFTVSHSLIRQPRRQARRLGAQGLRLAQPAPARHDGHLLLRGTAKSLAGDTSSSHQRVGISCSVRWDLVRPPHLPISPRTSPCLPIPPHTSP